MRILEKKYLKICFTLTSPLGVGAGKADITDRDIIRNSAGIPYIPATSIAGVLRERLEERADIDDVFGYVTIAGEGDPEAAKARESRIVFYDANPNTDDLPVTVRDSVALDEYKTAKKGSKFDMEVLEPGVSFVTYVEQSIYDRNEPDYTEWIAAAFHSGVKFGGKATRGYGEIRVDSVRKVAFALDSPQETERWLQFDLFSETVWEGADEEAGHLPEIGSHAVSVDIGLKQVGGISIRKYTTAPGDGEKALPDMEQMTAHGVDGIAPVIPGTTWAGAFRHHLMGLGIDEKELSDLFGYVRGTKKQRSKISFGESRITGAKEKVLSRNAIDRFDGGTKDGALYTEKTYYGGETHLIITWEKDSVSESVRKAFAASIADLHYGFLAIGGETSIGRGLFEVTEVNGQKRTGSGDVFSWIDQIITEVTR